MGNISDIVYIGVHVKRIKGQSKNEVILKMFTVAVKAQSKV